MALLTNAINLSNEITTKYLKLAATGGGGQKITITAPASFTSYSLTLPIDVGVNEQVLATDGAGATYWATGGGGVSGTSFADDDIEIYNATTATKKLHFVVGAATNTSRLVQMPNADVDLATLPTQMLYTTSTPQFAKLGVAQAAGTEQLEVTGAMKISTAGGLTVGASTPSAAQWAYLAGWNQALASTSSVLFSNIVASSLKLIETGGGTDKATLVAPAAANYTLTLPTSSGVAGEVLATDGAGVLSWASQGGGAGGSFSDSTFYIYNTAVSTKHIAFSVSSGTGVTRTVAMPDRNVDFANVPSQSVEVGGTPQFLKVGVGAPAGADQLEVTGNIKVSTAGGLTIGAATPSAAQWGYMAAFDQSLTSSSAVSFASANIGSGTVSLPSIYFGADTSSGFYRIGANNWGVAISGAKSLDISSSGVGLSGLLKIGDGSASAPSLTFSSDSDTGFYRIGADNVGISAGGVKKCDIGATQSTISGVKAKSRILYGTLYKKNSDAYVRNAISDWTAAATLFQSYSVTWSEELGLFATVGVSSPYVATSTNGRQWITRTTGVAGSWYSVCYGGGKFVAVGTPTAGYRAMTSVDGITWMSRATPADQAWNGVAYGAGYYCAVSGDGAVYRIMNSTDAITWNSVATPVLNAWRGICYGSASVGFVAVSSDGTTNHIMTSVTGTSWVSQTTPNANYYAVCYSPELNLYCAVGTAGAIATSSNGSTWSSQTSPSSSYFYSIAWSPELGIFYAVSYNANGISMYSNNGLNWYLNDLTVSSGTQQVHFSGICWSPLNNVFVACAGITSYPTLFYSYDPRANLALLEADFRSSTYKFATSANSTNSYTYWDSVWDPYHSTFIRSQLNGFSYSTYNYSASNWSISSGGSIYPFVFAVSKTYVQGVDSSGNSSVFYSSNGGSSFSSITLPTSTGWYGICYGPRMGKWVVTGGSGTNYNTSGDNTSYSSGSSYGGLLMRCLCYSNKLNIFVGVGAGGLYAVSYNGSSWTTGSMSGAGLTMWSVAWSPELELFCATGASSNSNNAIFISSDGITWEYVGLVFIPPFGTTNETAVRWASDMHMFILNAGSSGSVSSCGGAKSYDGRNWTFYGSIASGRMFSYASETGIMCSGITNAIVYTKYSMPKYIV